MLEPSRICPNAKKGPAATSADPFTEAPKLSDESPPTEGDPRIIPGEAESPWTATTLRLRSGLRHPYAHARAVSGISLFEPHSSV